MKFLLKLLTLMLLTTLVLAACSGGPTPKLAVAGKPTLVYIYTDG